MQRRRQPVTSVKNLAQSALNVFRMGVRLDCQQYSTQICSLNQLQSSKVITKDGLCRIRTSVNREKLQPTLSGILCFG